jgi:hypothetical protein
MADLELTITIIDLNVPKAAAAFLRKHPMPLIEDPENIGKKVDKYPSTRLWVEAWLTDKLLRAINKGIDMQAQDVAVKLTKEIFG